MRQDAKTSCPGRESQLGGCLGLDGGLLRTANESIKMSNVDVDLHTFGSHWSISSSLSEGRGVKLAHVCSCVTCRFL